MITDAQKQLAQRIAEAGIWKYAKVLELMEKKSPLIEYFKVALNPPSNVSYKIAGKSVSAQERAYANARLAEELGASQFAQAYVYYLNNSTPEVAKLVTDVAAKINPIREKRPEVTVEWIQQKQAQWLQEYDTYMASRREKCLQGV